MKTIFERNFPHRSFERVDFQGKKKKISKKFSLFNNITRKIRRITSLQKVPSKLYRMETLVREGGAKLFSKNELFEKEELCACIVIFRLFILRGKNF